MQSMLAYGRKKKWLLFQKLKIHLKCICSFCLIFSLVISSIVLLIAVVGDPFTERNERGQT